MIVKKDSRALILHLRDPNRVLSVIPTAKTLEYKGKTLTVMPHRTTEVKLLHNLGFAPPHPADHYYDWPAYGFQPMDAQRETVRFLTLHNRAYCLNGMGTGKTISGLWAFDYLRTEKAANKLLIIAPLSTLDSTWANELFRHFPHLSCVVVHSPDRQRRLALLEQEADVYITNHDGIKVLGDALIQRTDIDTVIVDELSQCARNASTARWKTLHALVQGRARVWGMTGTPTPNGPLDAWAQCRLLTPSTVPAYYTHWRAQTMIQRTTFKWEPRDNALETVEEAMQPAIRYKREDCIDLPPVMYETRSVPLTPDQAHAYKEMKDELYTLYKGGEITAVNAGVQAMRLIQIASGAAYDPDGNVVLMPPKPRFQATLDLIEEADSKVIVFVPFRASLHMVADEIAKHYTVEKIYGGVSKTERDRIFGAFQRADNPQVLVAQPAAMSHGLTLTAASVIVWFAPVTSAETYEQANARITRPGQKHNQLIAHIEGTEVERKLYDTLKNKTNMQNTLLDMFAKRVSA